MAPSSLSGKESGRAAIFAPSSSAAATPRCTLCGFSRYSGIFLELVCTIERWRVGGCGQAGTDAEAIDRGIRIQHPHKLVFVEPPACEDRHILQTSVAQNAPNTLRQHDQIA